MLKSLKMSDSPLAKHSSALEFVGLVLRRAGPVAASATAFFTFVTFIFAVVAQAAANPCP
jgi:hypothetical protein